MSIPTECQIHVDPGKDWSDKDDNESRAEIYNDRESRDGDKQGIRVVLLEGKAINRIRFWFYKQRDGAVIFWRW